MKYTITILIVILVLFAGWFFFFKDSGNKIPRNLPTAEDIERMEQVEQSSSKVDPNAKTGVGVRPVGSIPPTPEPEEEATSTSSTTTEEQGAP